MCDTTITVVSFRLAMLRQAAKRKQEKCASEVKELTKTDHAVNLHPEAIPLGTTPYQNEEEWRVERQVLGGEDEILEKLAQTVVCGNKFLHM